MKQNMQCDPIFGLKMEVHTLPYIPEYKVASNKRSAGLPWRSSG